VRAAFLHQADGSLQQMLAGFQPIGQSRRHIRRLIFSGTEKLQTLTRE
jgi:hypothetical protein